MRTLRNLSRRRLRTALTILGIAIGIWALVVFGSMANRINVMVAGGSEFFRSGAVTAWSGGGTAPQLNPTSIGAARALEKIAGVDAVVPGVGVLLSDDPSGISLGIPPMITGEIAGMDHGRNPLHLRAASGRLLAATDEGSDVVVLGSDLARQLGSKVGDRIDLRGDRFTVVGILAQTLTQPDNSAMVPLAAAQRLYLRSLPSLVASSLKADQLATTFTVYVKPDADPDAVATAIKDAFPEFGTMTAGDFDRMAGSYASMMNALLVGIGLISLVVGGLSVVNTMAMSIAERTREIGIKRAIGASRTRVLREIVLESGLIGSIGGAIGLALGALVVVAANEAGRSSGTILFELTAGTAVSAVAFATVLGALAGFVPALHAARLDPVTALRYE